MKKEKYQFGNNYRNFRPIIRAADYSHRSILGSNEKKISTDYPHWQIPRTQKQKKNRRLVQSSFSVFFDMLSFSVQLINFHTFCLRCFTENGTNCIKSVLKESISRDLPSRRNRLKRENTIAKKISLMHRIFCRAN